MELQSCAVGEGRKYCVVKYLKKDISTKVCGSFLDSMIFFSENTVMETQLLSENHFKQIEVVNISIGTF